MDIPEDFAAKRMSEDEFRFLVDPDYEQLSAYWSKKYDEEKVEKEKEKEKADKEVKELIKLLEKEKKNEEH